MSHKAMFGGAILAVSLAGCTSLFGGQKETPPATPEYLTIEQKASYAIGFITAQEAIESGFEMDQSAFISGLESALSGETPIYDEDERYSILEDFSIEMRNRQIAAQQAAAASALSAAEAFLAGNRDLEGIQTTDSGLQYRIIQPGTGNRPTFIDRVQVDYEGRLLNGTVFDSSYQRGEPAQFGVTDVISGWTEVLQLMPEGSVWEVYLHPDLGYGLSGAGGDIGPNALLIFKIELLDIIGD